MSPKIYSLHIGVSRVDEKHYLHQLKPLACCETDAKLMHQLAGYLGYDKSELLLNEAATTDNVEAKVKAFKKDLVAGDLCVITYSGHGSLIPDLNGDESETGVDGTWCLYNRQLIDDELPHLWKLFEEGVNVLVILDACHSGSSIKGFTEEEPKFFKQGASVYSANKDQYREILIRENVDESEVKCSVLLLSACQSDGEALSGDPLSYFTRIMIETLCYDATQLFNYEALFKKVRSISGQEKVIYPNYLTYGKPTTFFEKNKPFLKKDKAYPTSINTFYANWYIANLTPSTMKIYALLIGINEYPSNALSACVGDVDKMSAYLDTLASNSVEIEKEILKDEQAKKEGIVESIQTFLSKASDKDVALLYYSGHGAFENSNNRFPEQHNSYLECVVCHLKPNQSSGYLLADKEIRYLLGKLPNNPHLVTVFDCCHSGDIVRDKNTEKQIKRIAKPFKARDYEEFIFSEKIKKSDLKNKPTSVNFPFKNHVHLAACSPSQSAWEGKNGGVFTHYLIELLSATENRITYQDISRWSKIGMKSITREKQSPVFSIQGEGVVAGTSAWLNLHDSVSLKEKTSNIVYNKKLGWQLTQGKLMGIKAGLSLIIDPKGKKIKATIGKKVGFTTAAIAKWEDLGLDISKSIYPVVLDTIYADVNLYLNNIDGLKVEEASVREILESTDKVNLVDKVKEADFFINIFNGLVYISRNLDQFRPLAIQLDMTKEKLAERLQYQLASVIHWNHYDSLINPGANFDKPPIKVEIMESGEKEVWQDATDKEVPLSLPNEQAYISEENPECWVKFFKIRVTNVSREKLFVGVLSLDTGFGIESDVWDKQVVEFKPGESKFFYDESKEQESAEEPEGAIYIDNYQQVYNWKKESLHYKFIVNNFENFTNELGDFIQPSLEKPLLVDDLRGVVKKGTIRRSAIQNQKWTTLKTTISLPNPDYNKVSGTLANNLEDYEKDEKIGPFLLQLYLDHNMNGLQLESEVIQAPDGERGQKIGMGIGNIIDDYRRKRKFERAKLLFPNKPIIVAEGDSWFLYPILVKDIIDNVMEAYPVRSIAAAGDELDNYKKEGQLLKEVALHQPKYVLISGGGNDIIGQEIQNLLVDQQASGQSPESYLNEQFEINMTKLKSLYEYFIGELKKHDSVQQVFLHGYDYIRVDHPHKFVKKGWLNRYMIAKGIEPSDRKKVIAHLIDTFNELIKSLSDHDPFVTYLDLRGQVKKGKWHDEIHPNNEGFGVVSKVFVEAIEEQEANGIG